MDHKSFDEFWAEFLQVTFHADNPDLWPSRQRKAIWCQEHLNLTQGASILDLGCGDGLIDIWLSRMGFSLTAVDRSRSVLELAKAKDDTGKVYFLPADIRQIQFEKASFDAVMVLETSGLMDKNEELMLFKRINDWLLPGGKFVIDCCESAETFNSWKKMFPDGEVSCRSSFDSTVRMQHIDFSFTPTSGTAFGLFDPIRDDSPGISRYLYPKEELCSAMKNAGFNVQQVPH